MTSGAGMPASVVIAYATVIAGELSRMRLLLRMQLASFKHEIKTHVLHRWKGPVPPLSHSAPAATPPASPATAAAPPRHPSPALTSALVPAAAAAPAASMPTDAARPTIRQAARQTGGSLSASGPSP